ncbi:hypothetical protein BDN72DRAFT_784596 [Pluteus cervinus]|uniref:Uncharacterized protein n=1 Tax=Pluteus cervinus TaxID=181527 RepID=A0ACD3BHQ2_9AGAR|nr:hypothetical protein BDN72DRAFT_784596 [Pluteus cervinus]
MSTLNATGLQASQSKALKEREPKPVEQKAIQALKEMYSCKPTQTTFDIYTRDAIFHDPVGIADGAQSIKAQFIALAKIFDRADVARFRVLENPQRLSANTLLVDQDVSYYRSSSTTSPTKTMNSLLTVKLDDAGQIRSHVEEWNHEKTSSSEDGFLGMLNEQRKKATAALTEMLTNMKED